MVSIVDNVADGGPLPFNIPDESCGPFLYNIMKGLPTENCGQINADTGEEMTNGEFLRMCESIAVGLESYGVKPGDMIVLMGENSFRISAAAIACLFIAAPFGALDETLKAFELENLLRYYKPKVIFCNQKQLEDVLTAIDALKLDSTIILLDLNEVQRENSALLDPRVDAFPTIVGTANGKFTPKSATNNEKEIAMVIPSSGSTGLPKGVALSHHSIVYALTRGFTSSLNRSLQSSATLQFSHLYWISGIFSLLMSCIGAPRVFLSDESDASLLRAIKKYKPTWSFLAPPMVSTMLKHPDFKSEDMTSLTAIITGGAPLTEYVRDEFKKKLPSTMNIHVYGLTEVCGGVTKFYPSKDVSCVGQVDTGIQIKVVDKDTLATLAIGETGEVCVKSVATMIGYLGNPEATKIALDEEGWVHTGDLGYINPHGVLFLKGRIKQLIKYRNHQISPEEIEKCLASMPGIRDSGVVGLPHEQDQFHTIALVVREREANITESDVCDYIKENMSESNQLHGGVKFVEKIPRTEAKKVRRNELQKLAFSLVS